MRASNAGYRWSILFQGKQNLFTAGKVMMHKAFKIQIIPDTGQVFEAFSSWLSFRKYSCNAASILFSLHPGVSLTGVGPIAQLDTCLPLAGRSKAGREHQV
jgi:hypothetical protein